MYCATSPDLDAPGARGVVYYDSNCAPGACHPEACDPGAGAWLWEWSAGAAGVARGEDLQPPAAAAPLANGPAR